MADPEIKAVQLPADYRTIALAETKRFVEMVVEDAYRVGYEHGYEAAINRILKAARPKAQRLPANDHNKIARPSRPQEASAPGAETHKLIEAVIRASASGKASPTEVRMSPFNRTQIKRDAIRNAMRRGRKSGRYVSDGKGRYSLGNG